MPREADVNTSLPYVVGTVTQADAPVLVEARRHMFEDMKEVSASSLDVADALFAVWLEGRIESGEIIGYVAWPLGGEDAPVESVAAWLGAVSAHVHLTPPSEHGPTVRERCSSWRAARGASSTSKWGSSRHQRCAPSSRPWSSGRLRNALPGCRRSRARTTSCP
jgi:hypothetical protein